MKYFSSKWSFCFTFQLQKASTALNFWDRKTLLGSLDSSYSILNKKVCWYEFLFPPPSGMIYQIFHHTYFCLAIRYIIFIYHCLHFSFSVFSSVMLISWISNSFTLKVRQLILHLKQIWSYVAKRNKSFWSLCVFLQLSKKLSPSNGLMVYAWWFVLLLIIVRTIRIRKKLYDWCSDCL